MGATPPGSGRYAACVHSLGHYDRGRVGMYSWRLAKALDVSEGRRFEAVSARLTLTGTVRLPNVNGTPTSSTLMQAACKKRF